MITEYESICAICGRPKDETHHLVFGRGLRPLADKDGLVIPLCHTCHEKMHHDAFTGSLSKIIGQLQYETEKIEKGASHTEARESFRERYGISYL